VSDLLEAAANALGTPSALVQRSAAARAAANGTTAEDILSAWAGGEPMPAATPAPTAPTTAPEPEEAADTTPEAPARTAPVAVLEPPAAAEPEEEYEPEPEEVLEPVAMSERVRIAVRVGAWTGAAFGVIAFLVASGFWAPDAMLSEDGRPAVLATPGGLMLGSALISILFGATVASLSRAVTAWSNPAMQLSSSRSSTGWVGVGVGLILGVGGAAILTALGTPLSTAEPSPIQLPVLATFGVIVIGGALLGAITAAVPQVFGTPVALDEGEADEVAEIRKRIGHAITIPLTGVLLLLLLVLPFAITLFEANHLVTNGAAVIAIITAGGILGFSALAGSKPNMRLTFGEVMFAFVGIATVITIILAVFVFRG
jgi:hypothetical protein